MTTSGAGLTDASAGTAAMLAAATAAREIAANMRVVSDLMGEEMSDGLPLILSLLAGYVETLVAENKRLRAALGWTADGGGDE